MKKLTAFTAVALVGATLLAIPVLANGSGGSMGSHMKHGMMGHGAMHSEAYSSMTQDDRDSMHEEMGAVMKKWIPGFDLDKFKNSHNDKDENCQKGEGYNSQKHKGNN